MKIQESCSFRDSGTASYHVLHDPEPKYFKSSPLTCILLGDYKSIYNCRVIQEDLSAAATLEALGVLQVSCRG